jgi:hypothetical protein
VAGAILPLVFPRLQIPPFASQLVLLVFPGLAAAATWAYLSWVFVGHVAFPFTPWEPGSPVLGQILLWSVPYLAVVGLLWLRPSATAAGVLLPLGLLWLANRIGWHFSLAFAVVMLTLVAIVSLPRQLDRAVRTLIAAVAVTQAVIAWLMWPMPTRSNSDRAAQAVAEAMATAPPRSILIDDREAGPLLKWAPSLEPYLTTRDNGFEIAMSEPLTSVRYLLAMETDSTTTLDADRFPPRGFVRAWRWQGYILWKHPDAPTPALRFDALIDTGVSE